MSEKLERALRDAYLRGRRMGLNRALQIVARYRKITCVVHTRGEPAGEHQIVLGIIKGIRAAKKEMSP